MKLVRRLVLATTSFLLVATTVGPAVQAHATGSWETVGPSAISSATINYPNIAFSSNGTPYVAFTEEVSLFQYELNVKRFNGTTWEQVGSPNFSEGNAEIVVFEMSKQDVPYVAYMDASQSNKLTVQRFNGTDWEVVGSPGFTAHSPDGHDLAIAPDGTPYVAVADSADNRKATVMKFNGTSWENVGPTSFSDDSAVGLAIAITSTNVPYVIYNDYTNLGGRMISKRFDGDNWVSVGTDGFGAGMSLPDEHGFVMDSHDHPYVAYMDHPNGNGISVMHFNGTDWEQVGAAGFSNGQASNTGLALTSNDVPYVVYRDYDHGDKLTSQRFNGTDWELVGPVGFTPDFGYSGGIAISNRDIPYVVYGDGSQDFKLTVQRFAGGQDELSDPTTAVLANAENGKSVKVIGAFGTVLTCSGAFKESGLAKPDVGFDYPSGLVKYCFTTDFSNNQVTIIFVTDLQPSQVTIRKYNSVTGTYATVSNAVVTQTTYEGVPALSVSYTITDNGSLDENSTTGAVTDPVGVATAVLSAPDTGLGGSRIPDNSQAYAEFLAQ